MEQIVGGDIYIPLGSFMFFEGSVKYIVGLFEYFELLLNH